MAQRKLTYENRIILFLDFLGFKEIVERTEADRQYLHNLLDAIDLLHQVGRDDAELSKSQRITTFSDSVVLSYAVHEESAVFYLLTDVTFAIIDLAIKGFFVRGSRRRRVPSVSLTCSQIRCRKTRARQYAPL